MTVESEAIFLLDFRAELLLQIISIYRHRVPQKILHKIETKSQGKMNCTRDATILVRCYDAKIELLRNLPVRIDQHVYSLEINYRSKKKQVLITLLWLPGPPAYPVWQAAGSLNEIDAVYSSVGTIVVS